MSFILTTPDGGALMAALARGWGGRAGISYDQGIARYAYELARENLAIAWDSRGSRGYPLGRRIALTRIRRCLAAIRRIDLEMKTWEEDHGRL